MKTQITENDDILIFRLQGIADIEDFISLEETCKKYCNKRKVIFNLAELNFVGTSGLNSLMQIMSHLTQTSKLKVCSVGKEFKRVFDSTQLSQLTFYENETSAQNAFIENPADTPSSPQESKSSTSDEPF